MKFNSYIIGKLAWIKKKHENSTDLQAKMNLTIYLPGNCTGATVVTGSLGCQRSVQLGIFRFIPL